jgi:hypothetical protein
LIATIAGMITVLVVLVYCGWVIASQERRWQRFEAHVHERDARWEQYITRTDSNLHRILEQLARMEAKP